MTDTISPSERSRVMAAVKSKDTTPEMIVRRLVYAMGYRYRLHVRSLPGSPDMVFPRLQKIINVNGCFWHMHRCPRCRIPSSHRRYWTAKLRRNAERDATVRRQLRQKGWQLLVVWECQTTPQKQESLRNRLAKFLAAPLPDREIRARL